MILGCIRNDSYHDRKEPGLTLLFLNEDAYVKKPRDKGHIADEIYKWRAEVPSNLHVRYH